MADAWPSEGEMFDAFSAILRQTTDALITEWRVNVVCSEFSKGMGITAKDNTCDKQEKVITLPREQEHNHHDKETDKIVLKTNPDQHLNLQSSQRNGVVLTLDLNQACYPNQ